MRKIVIDGPDQILYQWEKGQRLHLIDMEGKIWVDFARCGNNKGTPSDAYAEDGNVYCDIPDALLMEHGTLMAYVRRANEDREETIYVHSLYVFPAPKPGDYVEPEEVLTWHELEQRIEVLEKSGLPSFGENYEGKLLYVVGGALVPLALGPGLTIRNGTLYITGGGGDVETGITVETDDSGVFRVYADGVEILPTVDEDGVISWPGVSLSVDTSGTLIFEEE